MAKPGVPDMLRKWFVVHFAVDMAFAIPLMLAPEFTLKLFGWQVVDPLATRLVAAALFGIGIESYLGRNAGVEAYQGMLRLKIIWSLAAVIGIGWSLLQGALPNTYAGWILLLVFIGFNGLWIYWRRKT
ncbi:MAG: hypothetical protein O3B43_00695 [Chloroflexi bacterium]|nr:hypothetical protein [Chloroflexota bacterium]